MIWKKLTLFAATLLFPFAVLHAVGVAEAAFRCDFEWMKQVEYDFLNFEEATGSIVKDDSGDSENSFLRLVNVRPSHYLVLTIQLNMKYRPGQTLRFRHREDTEIPGNDNYAYIGIGLQTEDGGKFYGEVSSASYWQNAEKMLSEMTPLNGILLTPDSVLTQITIYGRTQGSEPADLRQMTLDLDDIEFLEKESPPLLSANNPPFFNWRKNMGTVDLEYSQDPDFPEMGTTHVRTARNFFTPSAPLEPGIWYVRVTDANSRSDATVRVEVPENAMTFTTQEIDPEKLGARPYPRLPGLSAEDKADPVALRKEFETLDAMGIPKNPRRWQGNGDPDYPSFISWYGGVHDRLVLSSGVRLEKMAKIADALDSDELRERVFTAAMKIVAWDPNDGSSHEAGDIGAYHVQRGLDYAYDILKNHKSDDELKPIRDMIIIRAEQVQRVLNPFPRGTHKEYNNHAWLAILGMAEGGVVLAGDWPDAVDRVEYARQLYLGLFLPIQGTQGENGEGVVYWAYGGNFLKLFGELMKHACDIDLFQHPWLGKTVRFPIYSCIPNTYAISFANSGKPNHGNFGPLKGESRYVKELALLSGDPYGLWYSNTALPVDGLSPQIPARLPQSIFYDSIGWGIFNTSIVDGTRNVSVGMHAGTYGRAHQHDDQNSITVNAYGDKLLIDSGYYDYFGSRHFEQYSIKTRAHNTILVDQQSQNGRKDGAGAEMTRFFDNRSFGYMTGEAGNPTLNGGKLEQFERRVLFVKPEFIITHDVIKANQPVELAYLAHSSYPLFASSPRRYFDIIGEKAELYARVLAPKEVTFSISTGYDVEPVRPRGNNEWLEESEVVREYHLAAALPEKVSQADFLVAMQIRPQPVTRDSRAKITDVECAAGRAFRAVKADKSVVIGASRLNDGELAVDGLSTDGTLAAARLDAQGNVLCAIAADATVLKFGDKVLATASEPGMLTFPADDLEAVNAVDSLQLSVGGADRSFEGVRVKRAADWLTYYSGSFECGEETVEVTIPGTDVHLISDMVPIPGTVADGKTHFSWTPGSGAHFLVISISESL